MNPANWLRGLTPDSFVLLAPAEQIPGQYSSVSYDRSGYDLWLRSAQQLRGLSYLADGAVSEDHLTSDGRLVSPSDRRSWHVIAHEDGDACATMRLTYYRRRVSPDNLTLARSGLFLSEIAQRSRAAIASLQETCLASGEVFAEVGGWAAVSSRRGSRRSSAVLLSCWPVSRAQGSVRAVSTVTDRNQSIDMLSRIGAVPLRDANGDLPPYYDSLYSCRMHLASLATDRLNPTFEGAVCHLADILAAAPTFPCPAAFSREEATHADDQCCVAGAR